MEGCADAEGMTPRRFKLGLNATDVLPEEKATLFVTIERDEALAPAQETARMEERTTPGRSGIVWRKMVLIIPYRVYSSTGWD